MNYFSFKVYIQKTFSKKIKFAWNNSKNQNLRESNQSQNFTALHYKDILEHHERQFFSLWSVRLPCSGKWELLYWRGNILPRNTWSLIKNIYLLQFVISATIVTPLDFILDFKQWKMFHGKHFGFGLYDANKDILIFNFQENKMQNQCIYKSIR